MEEGLYFEQKKSDPNCQAGGNGSDKKWNLNEFK